MPIRAEKRRFIRDFLSFANGNGLTTGRAAVAPVKGQERSKNQRRVSCNRPDFAWWTADKPVLRQRPGDRADATEAWPDGFPSRSQPPRDIFQSPPWHAAPVRCRSSRRANAVAVGQPTT